MIPDAVLFGDIWPIQSQLRVQNTAVISVYEIGSVSLFIVLKDGASKM
jgi:hypothetical protein